MMRRWIAAAQEELDVDLEVDVAGLLDMARTVAHEVARPAAPLTAFLVGYAAARAGGGEAAVAEANAKAQGLAERWAAEHSDEARTADDAGHTGGAGGAA
ncbi:DUF6457 domain-containing protein [Streptomyces solicathayae]|uniref:DUF6457 domain-containing protein n=1 Tax=Streptomyces solicathayae TaxID=3081768 RepID=UPI00398D1462